MSAGRISEGVGCIAWWGFSPARDLSSMGPVRPEGELNVLLVGSGDPRHILKTAAGLQNDGSLHVWVIESSMEVVARQLLLLYLALMPQETMGDNEKTEVFLEVFGNSEIRSQTEETLRCAASQLSLSILRPAHKKLDCSFRERDELARIFKGWIHPQSPSVLMSKAWDYRVREHLGTRYNCKSGCFDWDLSMKLHEKGCGVINKQQYARWREQGLAFEVREGAYQITNPTLLSSRVFSQRGNKVAFKGYWGDIVSSPYLAFGIETEDKSLLKTQNGLHVKVKHTLLIRACAINRILTSASIFASNNDKNNTSECFSDLMHLKGISVTFLPMDALHKLPEKQKHSHFFGAIYFSARFLSPIFTSILFFLVNNPYFLQARCKYCNLT
uniref:Dynein axonemal assembly factor 3 n=1 Tax=Mola mola TaxID=94237 RepID=A0A3Q4AE81_MOLML